MVSCKCVGRVDKQKGYIRINQMKAIMWVIVNGLLSWAAYSGVNGSVGAGNIFVFTTWLAVVNSFVICLANTIDPQTMEKELSKGPSVPLNISNVYDLGMISYLAYNGWWWTAIGTTLGMVLLAVVYHKPTETVIDQ